MPFNVTDGSAIACPMAMGGKTSVIKVTTPRPVLATAPLCTINDFTPLVNVLSFGTCISTQNPAVKPPTNAAPCVPATITPWTPGSATSKVNGIPVLTDASTCKCAWLPPPLAIAVVTPSQQFVAGT